MSTETRQEEEFDNPIERLELLAGDDAAISSFLDRIDVTGPRDREMLAELARTRTLADPHRFPSAHRRAVAGLETLARHGFHGSRAAGALGHRAGWRARREDENLGQRRASSSSTWPRPVRQSGNCSPNAFSSRETSRTDHAGRRARVG